MIKSLVGYFCNIQTAKNNKTFNDITKPKLKVLSILNYYKYFRETNKGDKKKYKTFVRPVLLKKI